MAEHSGDIIRFLVGRKQLNRGKRLLEARIEKEGLTERAIILCKLNKRLLESSISVGIHRQKSLYYLMNLFI